MAAAEKLTAFQSVRSSPELPACFEGARRKGYYACWSRKTTLPRMNRLKILFAPAKV